MQQTRLKRVHPGVATGLLMIILSFSCSKEIMKKIRDLTAEKLTCQRKKEMDTSKFEAPCVIDDLLAEALKTPLGGLDRLLDRHGCCSTMLPNLSGWERRQSVHQYAAPTPRENRLDLSITSLLHQCASCARFRLCGECVPWLG